MRTILAVSRRRLLGMELDYNYTEALKDLREALLCYSAECDNPVIGCGFCKCKHKMDRTGKQAKSIRIRFN